MVRRQSPLAVIDDSTPRIACDSQGSRAVGREPCVPKDLRRLVPPLADWERSEQLYEALDLAARRGHVSRLLCRRRALERACRLRAGPRRLVDLDGCALLGDRETRVRHAEQDGEKNAQE